MGLLEKVRDFFYDEEDDDVPDFVKPKKHPKEHFNDKKIVKKEVKTEKIENQEEEKQDISERELFKAERTFNFPMDVDDEYTNVGRPRNVQKPNINQIQNNYEKSQYTGLREYSRYDHPKEDEIKQNSTPKKFKPTPVISPIYGIMDKNYKKEDLIIEKVKSEEKTVKVDYDSVRKKAYANIYPEEEKEQEEEKKDIFYNLDDTDVEGDISSENDDVKIVYNDVTFDDESDDDNNDENVTIGEKIEQEQRKSKEIKEPPTEDDIDEESQILSETKEQDLFNLIDNMYNSEENEEEEEVE